MNGRRSSGRAPSRASPAPAALASRAGVRSGPFPSPVGLLAWAALAALAAGCGGGDEAPAERRATPDRSEADPGAAAPARYLTDLTFVAAGGASGLYLHFENRTSPAALARRYRGWTLEEGGWSSLFVLTDTLPTPAAAWRVLPAPGLGVLAGSGGEIAGLRVVAGSGARRVIPDASLASWPGPTGQLERLLSARVEGPGGERSGFLLERRTARPLESPPARADDLAVLVVGERGSGFLFTRGIAEGAAGARVDSAAAARGWVDGRAVTWPELVLRRRDGGEEGTCLWRVDSGDPGLSGELTLSPGPSGGTAADLLLYRVDGRLILEGEERSVTGIAVRGHRP